MQYQINEIVDVIKHNDKQPVFINNRKVLQNDYIVQFHDGRIIVFNEEEFNALFKPFPKETINAPSVLDKPEIKIDWKKYVGTGGTTYQPPEGWTILCTI